MNQSYYVGVCYCYMISIIVWFIYETHFRQQISHFDNINTILYKSLVKTRSIRQGDDNHNQSSMFSAWPFFSHLVFRRWRHQKTSSQSVFCFLFWINSSSFLFSSNQKIEKLTKKLRNHIILCNFMCFTISLPLFQYLSNFPLV